MLSPSPTNTPTIAFFGATGGCTNNCLYYALKDGHSASALARTPAKLEKQLLAQGLSEEILSRQLTIIAGDALDLSAVKRTLVPAGGRLVSTIVCGIGGAPTVTMSLSLRQPMHLGKPGEQDLCARATQTLLTALRELYSTTPALTATKPLVMFVSTTGITTGPADVPFAMRFLYHQVLAGPHMDKRNMESLYRTNMAEPVEAKRLFRGTVGIRPTLLAGGALASDSIGLDKIKVGKEQSPALGYIIRRADVGHWMFENVIKDGSRGWENEMVTLTS